jgi:hypothetical protein
MKSTRVSTSGQLSEHCARKPELRLDYKVHKVVGHPRVVTGRRVHTDIRKRRALRFYRVPSLTCASKDEYHLRLPNAVLQRLAHTTASPLPALVRPRLLKSVF